MAAWSMVPILGDLDIFRWMEQKYLETALHIQNRNQQRVENEFAPEDYAWLCISGWLMDFPITHSPRHLLALVESEWKCFPLWNRCHLDHTWVSRQALFACLLLCFVRWQTQRGTENTSPDPLAWPWGVHINNPVPTVVKRWKVLLEWVIALLRYINYLPLGQVYGAHVNKMGLNCYFIRLFKILLSLLLISIFFFMIHRCRQSQWIVATMRSYCALWEEASKKKDSEQPGGKRTTFQI